MNLKNKFYTAVFYLYFIVWGLVFTFIGIPLIELLRRGIPRITEIYFWLTHLFYTNLIRMLTLLGAISVSTFEGEEYLHQETPCIYVSNHRTMLDVLIYFTYLRKTNCLIKAGPNPRRITKTDETHTKRRSMPGWWLPFITGSLKILGYIKMPESKMDFAGLKETIDECSKSLQNGRSIIIFPEGTRSRTGRLLPFLTLPFKLACQEKVPIVPMIIHNDYPIMPKGTIKINVPGRVHFHVKVLPPVYTDDCIDPQSLLLKVRKIMSRSLRQVNEIYGEMEVPDDSKFK